MTADPQSRGEAAVGDLNTYRNILRGILLIGGSTVVAALFGLARNKLLAVVGGPASVGLVGLLASAMRVMSGTGSMGLGMAGVRELVGAGADQLPILRASLRLYALVLSAACLGIVLAFSRPIGAQLLDGEGGAATVGWLAFGAAAIILSNALETELRALHRVRDIAASNILSAAGATGIVALWVWLAGAAVELAFVLVPVLSVMLAHLRYVRRLPPIGLSALPRLSALVRPWRGFIAVGVPLMLATAATMAVELTLRLVIEERAGLAALGLFVGVHLLSANYLGFILKAVGTDYFPRLSATIGSPQEAVVMINRQMRVLLILGAPVLLAIFGLADIVLSVLYTAEFAASAQLLQLYLLGDFLKLVLLPAGFSIVAAGRSGLFLLGEIVIHLLFLGLAVAFFQGDLKVIGLAYLITRAVHGVIVCVLAGRLIRFRIGAVNLAYCCLFAVLVLLVHATSHYLVGAGRIVTLLVAAGLAGHAYLGLRALLAAERSRNGA